MKNSHVILEEVLLLLANWKYLFHSVNNAHPNPVNPNIWLIRTFIPTKDVSPSSLISDIFVEQGLFVLKFKRSNFLLVSFAYTHSFEQLCLSRGDVSHTASTLP